jgi:dihydrofolate reductase
MRKLVMWNVQTLDGCLEGAKPWDLDFHSAAWGDELQRFSADQEAEVGTLLFERATYEGMADYWRTATGATADFMNAVPKVIFSRTLKSAKLCDSLMRRGLFDELRICIAPVVLRGGVPLFKPGGPRQDLSLLESRTLDTGGVILRYAMKAPHVG